MTIFETLQLTGTGEAKHRQIADHLAGLVLNGALKPGDRLPPVRPAAWQLGIHPGTVARAYRTLEVRGLAHGEVGRGTYIGAAAGTAGLSMQPAQPGKVDLSINSFAIEPPREELAAAFEYAAKGLRDGSVATSYVGESGQAAALDAILPWLSQRIGPLQREQLLIANGGQSALHSALSAFVGAGAGAACDALTYPGTIAAAAQLGVPLTGIAMDGDGLCPEALDEACRRRRIAVLVTSPGINNPTGITMPQKRREAVAAVAARHSLTIIEDEVYGFLGDDGLAPLARLLPQQTVYFASLSKIVAPALRVGYLAGPPALVRRAALAHKNSQMMVSQMLTTAATHIVMAGVLERRKTLLREEMNRRTAEACTLLDLARPAGQPSGLIWLPVPECWRLGEFCREAERRGVMVAPAELFSVEAGRAPHAVRLSLSAEADAGHVYSGIGIIADLLRTENPSPVATV